ncbi:MAG: DUF5130 family protein [Nocardioidaceae bacterium]
MRHSLLSSATRSIEQSDPPKSCPGVTFYVHVGRSGGDTRRTALALHGAVERPANAILVHVDPAERTLEIVTGSEVRRDGQRQAGGARWLVHADGLRGG